MPATIDDISSLTAVEEALQEWRDQTMAKK